MSALKVTSKATFVASIPYLLGFQPQESHVIVWLNEDNSVGLVQRTNLDDAHDPRIVDAGALHGFQAAICVTFSDTRPEELSDLHFDIGEALEEFGVSVNDLIHCQDSRFWSYLQPAEEMLADPGTEIDEETILSVRSRFAMEGMSSLDSRQSLIDEVTPAQVTAHRYAAAVRHWKRIYDDIGTVPGRYEALAYADALRYDGMADERDLIRFSASLEDVPLRDTIIWHLSQMDRESLYDIYKTIASAVRVTPKKHAAPILSVASICAYLSGNGASANVCLDIAVESNPDYSMLKVLSVMLSSGMNPTDFGATLSSLDPDQVMSEEV